MFYLVIIFALFGLDLGIKQYIETHKELRKEETILGGKIIVTKYYNEGAFLNAMEQRKKLLLMISGAFFSILFLFLILLLPQKGKHFLKFALALTIGGAASNMFDRVTKGYVVDYFSFSFFRKVVFNISDFCIFIGSLLLAIIAIIKS